MRKPQEVYVYGSGGHGKVVAAVLESDGFRLKAFLDDSSGRVGRKVCGVRVESGFAFMGKAGPTTKCVIAAIGNNTARARVFEELKKKNFILVAAKHRSAVIHESVKIGEGTVVMPGVTVNIDSVIGVDSILNTSVSVDHDCVIGNHVHLAPGTVLAGNVSVGDYALLGVGAKVIPGIKIGDRATVGAGAVVIEDVPAGATVAGVPAKKLAAGRSGGIHSGPSH